MSRQVYRLLLLLLPPRRRTRFGDDMVDLFEQLRQREQRDRGRFAAALLDLREVGGIVRFVLREWAAFLREAMPGGSADLGTELRWVWRGIRSRGWSAPLIVLLLAGAIGATATTFSVADALVFNRHPYPDADRIVSLEQFVEPERRAGRPASADLHDEWRRHRDLFVAAGGYLQKNGVFLQDNTSSEQVSAADITIEFLDVLGAAPAWGRPFAESDLTSVDSYAALVSEKLARRRFGSPGAALGQRLEATGRPLVIVGVMPGTFAFPSAGTDVWRLMDPRGPLTTNFGGVGLMARLAPGVPIDAVDDMIRQRTPSIGAATELPNLQVSARPFFERSARQAEAARDIDRLFMLLLGAGVSLLLISCANVASLELAHAIRRTHASTVRVALGASRILLARLATLEGLALAGAGLVGGLVVTTFLLGLADSYLPSSFTRTQNPIDVDGRVVLFSVAAAAMAWALLTLPAVLHVAGRRPLVLGQRATSSGSARLRHQLTVLQVALAVSLVIVGLMYSRSYRELLILDKGFDSSGVAVVSVNTPSNYFATGSDRETTTERLLTEIRRLPGVLAASRSWPPPSVGDSPMRTPLWIDGRQVLDEVLFGRHWTDLAYFDVTRVPLLAGRLLQPGDAPTNVVIQESFARRFWPEGGAVGGTIRGGEKTWFVDTMTVVGVVGDFRRNATRLPGDDDPLFAYHLPAPPPPAAAAGPVDTQNFVDSGGSYGLIGVSVRVAGAGVLPAVEAAVQGLDARLAVTLRLVDDDYARLSAPTLLAARAVGIFSLVSFAIAMAGLYGVVAFVVSIRTREIGIRMALGAAASDIRRMVLAVSGRMVLVGATAGVAMAFGVARWIESQLFGVSPSDPATYAVVVAAVGLTAVIATWAPARRAAATDPAITLRAE